MMKLFGVEGLFTGLVLALVTASSQVAFADPNCMARNQILPMNNNQVMTWKASPQIRNGWKGRGNVEGVVVGLIPDRNGHDHFMIQIGPTRTDLLEVVYNQDFGVLPEIHAGMRVHACGDFIKSIAQNGPYPASPAGAIVHWVHQNPNHNGHEDGYIVLDGVLYGNGPDRKAGNNGNHGNQARGPQNRGYNNYVNGRDARNGCYFKGHISACR